MLVGLHGYNKVGVLEKAEVVGPGEDCRNQVMGEESMEGSEICNSGFCHAYYFCCKLV